MGLDFFQRLSTQTAQVRRVERDGWTAFFVSGDKNADAAMARVETVFVSGGLAGGENHDMGGASDPRDDAITSYFAGPGQPVMYVVADNPGKSPTDAQVRDAFETSSTNWTKVRSTAAASAPSAVAA